MNRYCLTIEYDGRNYSGWQAQDNLPTVQGSIETAIAAFSGETPRIQGAGRTDAGVHARNQCAHVEFARDWEPDRVQGAINAHLRIAGHYAIAILAAKRVAPDFDARFSAKARHYCYRILTRRAPLALDRGRAWHVTRTLDGKRMDEAAKRLLGLHDFTTFRSIQCQAKSPLRTLDRLDVEQNGEEILIWASARSFLHNQVRSLAGALKRVGEGGWTPDDVTAALEAKSRAACAPVAPPDGLYLMGVDYSD